MIRKHEPDTDSFQCKECKEMFSNSQELEVHKNVHKKFTCVLCDRQFCNEDDIKKHEDNEHSVEEMLPST